MKGVKWRQHVLRKLINAKIDRDIKNAAYQLKKECPQVLPIEFQKDTSDMFLYQMMIAINKADKINAEHQVAVQANDQNDKPHDLS